MDKTNPSSAVKPFLTRSSHRFALEPRLMYDAAGLISGLEGIGQHAEDPTVQDHGEPVMETFNHVPTSSVVFVDSRVEDYRSLLGNVTPATRVVVLDSQRDGVEQISSVLSEYRGLDSIHILSHGEAGSLQLGAGNLTGESLERQAMQVQQWSNALSDKADLLIYGCNVAEGEKGQAFVERLGQLTGADVAASDDATGSAARQADWDLEYQQGQIDTTLLAEEDYQHVLSMSTLGGEFQVNTITAEAQTRVDAAELSNGGHVVVWQTTGASNADIHLQLYSELGEETSYEIQVNTTVASEQSQPKVAALDDGGFVVTWQSLDTEGTGYNIFYQRFNSDGVPQGDEIRVNTTTDNDQQSPAIASLANGQFVITWHSMNQDGSGSGIYGRIYNGDGTAAGDEIQLNTTTSYSQYNPAVSGLQEGGFVVVWQSDSDNDSLSDVIGQRFDANGDLVGSEFLVAEQSESQVDVAGLESGGFVVTWNSNIYGGADSSGQGVYAKIYDSDGAVQKESFLVNTTLAGNQRYASVSSLPYGGFVVTWATKAGESASDYNICGQRFTASGAKDGGEFVVNATTSSVQDRPVVASHGTGFLVLWQSLDQDGDNYGIFGQRYGLNDPPVLDNSAIFYPGTGIQGLPVDFSIDRLLGNSVTDEDQGAVEGIAIIGLDSSHGTWYYSLDGGVNWQVIDGASSTSALLLAAGGGSKLRFVASEFSFVGAAEFNFKAWDQNFGVNGQRVNLNSDDARISTSVAIGLARVRVEPLPPPIQTPDREQIGVGDREDSNQTSTSLAQFIQSLVQAGQVQVSTLSQEQLMRMYQEFLARNGLNAEGIIVSTDGEGATKTADGANQEAALGQVLIAARSEGEHAGDAQGGRRGDVVALGANLSKQLEGQTHRTEAERQELAKVLHEIQGLLNCN